MSKKKEHLALLSKGDMHDKGACICSHGSKPTGSACDYQKNGYDITESSRQHLYNNKKRTIDSQKAMRDVYTEVFLKAADPGRQLKLWMNRLKGAARRLNDDPKAWNVGYSCYPEKGKNFLPLAHGGAGWWYPYMHNWHHIIPQSAPYEFIVGGVGAAGPLSLQYL